MTDHVWYFAGPLGGDRLLRLYCWLTFSPPDCVRRTTDWCKRFGALIIVVGRFVAVVRVLTWPLARDHGVSYPTLPRARRDGRAGVDVDSGSGSAGFSAIGG